MLTACQEYDYRIGFSQCYHNDWNLQLTHDIQREVNSHPEIQLISRVCTEGVQRQVEDIRQFIRDGVDLIIVAPEDQHTIGPIVDEAAAAGIPVLLIDSETTSHKFLASICTDNIIIGERQAQYAVTRLGGHGKVLAILGVEGSTASHDRLRGFRNALTDFPEIQIVDSCYGNWNYSTSLRLIDSLLTLHPNVDAIACQSDPMALAAHDACVKHGMNKRPLILGVDGLMGKGNGIENIVEGKIDATCINPTGGLQAIHLALEILQKKPFDRNIKLTTQLIDQDNVNIYLQQEQRVDLLTERIEEVNGRLGRYFQRSYLLQIIVAIVILLLLLISAFAIYISRTRKQRHRMQYKMAQANQAKLNFFANVSHSFRTPLTLIADPIRTLKQEGNLTERQLSILDLMETQSDKLMQMTDQVLKVLQNDLLRDGTSLDAVAQKSANAQQSAADLRKKDLGAKADIKADEMRKTILIIDDNAEIRSYLSLILEKRNYMVLTAPNGEEGLLVAQQNIPDLIICDVMMPVMDGLECCRRLKADQATSYIPVLMLTAYALDDQRIQGYQSGADAYITKPFNTEVLCARIQNLIESRKHIDTKKEHTQEMNRLELGSVDRQFVQHFHDFVINNMSDVDLDVQQLSGEFNMSRVQLYRKCKSITGKSPVEIIRDIRLKAATDLLQGSDRSVSEVAYEVGFSSPSYFAKCYKDQYGISPTDAQKKRQ